MALLGIFDIAGSGMSAQTLRLSTTASNLSNAEIPASSAEATYKARYPLFSTALQEAGGEFANAGSGVQVDGIFENDQPGRKIHQPGHAMADEKGYVYYPNVSVMEEMTNMISASRTYQMNVQVLSNAKQLMLRTLEAMR